MSLSLIVASTKDVPAYAAKTCSPAMSDQDTLFNEAWSTHKAAIARVVQSYEAIPALQDELLQDIAFAVWRSLPRFNQRSSLKTYLLSIAHNRSVSHVAKYAREAVATSSDDVEIVGNDRPDETLAEQRQTQALISAIRQLPMAQRQLLTLALEGLSYDDIASILGITVNNVGVRLNRAKSALKQTFERSGHADE